jgi:hypothetical protein
VLWMAPLRRTPGSDRRDIRRVRAWCGWSRGRLREVAVWSVGPVTGQSKSGGFPNDNGPCPSRLSPSVAASGAPEAADGHASLFGGSLCASSGHTTSTTARVSSDMVSIADDQEERGECVVGRLA